MTDSRAFCPRCGEPVPDRSAEDADGQAVDPLRPGAEVELCDACYFEGFDFVDAPDRIDVRVCAQCGAVYRGNRWVDVGADDYTDVAVEEVSKALSVHVDVDDVAWQVEPEQIDPNTIRMHCYFTGVVRGTPVEEQLMIPVKIARQTCTRCGRIAGDYYASIVQIRAEDRTPTSEEIDRAKTIANRVVADMEATGDRNAFITEMGEVDDGLNMRVSTNKIGKKISSKMVEEFGGTVNDAETLVTEDEDGNEVYRVTFAVRLPPYRPGDVIDLTDDDDGPVLVRSAHGNLKGTRVTTGERYEASYEDGASPDARKLGRLEDGVETTVVTVEDENAVQILDPETYEAKTVSRPAYFDPDAQTVPVLKSRAGLHVLPDPDPKTEDDAETEYYDPYTDHGESDA
ncbi:60S ribosomal export protein NMD3 [Natrarchaeobaculum sulfurireducens]|uniref:NMD protein affecting ribosome stability and mRNA decay n=1 Tax=Natrarchaeobaculum sulfurireducens TaxID=2044521 RepID=A0A346PKT8_9EURY|nr:60S ribosomal export protein NMD3 [Natrarchaeobaculum sulfurireducens]AXR76457.1 NMD protein affecting ribosome stability and mRNA decay [Natrarchaeobaculum sulfurireducens]AXR80133.1 NMD protein affecting ribosome stability and mRNA decay [Natrarchaeobaculum sulfurireducens]